MNAIVNFSRPDGRYIGIEKTDRGYDVMIEMQDDIYPAVSGVDLQFATEIYRDELEHSTEEDVIGMHYQALCKRDGTGDPLRRLLDSRKEAPR